MPSQKTRVYAIIRSSDQSHGPSGPHDFLVHLDDEVKARLEDLCSRLHTFGEMFPNPDECGPMRFYVDADCLILPIAMAEAAKLSPNNIEVVFLHKLPVKYEKAVRSGYPFFEISRDNKVLKVRWGLKETDDALVFSGWVRLQPVLDQIPS